MKEQKYLSKRQIELIDDIFKSKLSEVEVLKRNNVSPRLYRKWLKDKLFAEEVSFRVESNKRDYEKVIARHALKAANKLISLTEDEKGETVRKVCLDIISLPKCKVVIPQKAEQTGTGTDTKLKPELAGKLLDVLAKEKV